MNLEIVLKNIDGVVFARVGRHLRDVEMIVLQGQGERILIANKNRKANSNV